VVEAGQGQENGGGKGGDVESQCMSNFWGKSSETSHKVPRGKRVRKTEEHPFNRKKSRAGVKINSRSLLHLVTGFVEETKANGRPSIAGGGPH